MPETSIIAVDFGNVQTRAVLIDLVESVYTLVAQAETRTTGGFPLGDVGVGFRRALALLSMSTGRRFLDDDGAAITPEQVDRSGVDVIVATASIGRPLRTVLIGLVPGLSVESAQRAAAGTYVNVVETISLDDNRSQQEQLNAIILARPDLIFITGGAEGGAREAVLSLAGTAVLALRLMQRTPKPNVLFAGNSALHDEITRMFNGVTTVFFADNVRPSVVDERLEGAQTQLAVAFDQFTEARGLGFNEVSYVSRIGVAPTAQSYHTITEYLGRALSEDRRSRRRGGVLIADIGSATSTLSASVEGHASTSIRTDIGLGHSAKSLLDMVGVEAVRAWLPFLADDNEIISYALNKTLRPATIPEMTRTLYLEHALLRAGLRSMLTTARPTWTPDTALDDVNAPLPLFQRIIAAGGALTNTGQPGMTAMLVLDALQPIGVTELQIDPGGLIPALGALARVNPEAVVQVLDAGRGLQTVATVINLSGTARKGRTAARVTITPENGERIKVRVPGGSLWVYDALPQGVRATITVRAGLGMNIGGRRAVKMEIVGGLAGVVIDARGRPLPIEPTLRLRAEQIPQWYADAINGEVVPIPPEWLTPKALPVEEAPAQPARRRGRRAAATADANGSTRRRGRRGRQQEAVAEAEPDLPVSDEDDIDDLRNLFS